MPILFLRRWQFWESSLSPVAYLQSRARRCDAWRLTTHPSSSPIDFEGSLALEHARRSGRARAFMQTYDDIKPGRQPIHAGGHIGSCQGITMPGSDGLLLEPGQQFDRGLSAIQSLV